jgi:hypothetical protein
MDHSMFMMLSGKIHDDLVFPLLTDTPIRLMTTEVILQFAFGRSGGLIEEDQNGFRSWFLEGFDAASKSIPDLQYKPWLRHLTNIIPQALVYKLSPDIGNLLDMLKVRFLAVQKMSSVLLAN